MINSATIIGNLGDDPVSRAMPSGSEVANFSVATTRRWKDRNTGEQKEATEWHSVAAFGKLAEICNQWLRKGAQVYIEGELRTRSWEKDGHKHYKTEIIANTMKMLGKKSGDRQTGPATGRGQLPEEKNHNAATGGGGHPGPDSLKKNPDDFDDDIPF